MRHAGRKALMESILIIRDEIDKARHHRRLICASSLCSQRHTGTDINKLSPYGSYNARARYRRDELPWRDISLYFIDDTEGRGVIISKFNALAHLNRHHKRRELGRQLVSCVSRLIKSARTIYYQRVSRAVAYASCWRMAIDEY